MARTWSNAKSTDTRSAAQRAKNRPSSVTLFLVLMSIVILFFMSLMTFATVHATIHPQLERDVLGTQEPKGE